MSTEKQYVPQIRVEHLIATGRLVLAVFFLIAVWIDPSKPFQNATLTYDLLAYYLIYSLVLLGALTWQKDHIRNHLLVVTHSVDLLVFSLLMSLTEGPNSPFFVFFIFFLVCATLRWQWRGTLWSAVAALFVVIALALYPHNLLHDPNFEMNRFIIRIAYLAVVATMLGFLGAHEQSIRNIHTMLADWPHTVSDELQIITKEMLAHAATILGVPRILLTWEAEEEPWLHLVLWTQQGCQYSREHPDALGTLVAGPLAGTSFFCRDVTDPHPQVVHNSPVGLQGLQGLQGSPLQKQLQERFTISTVLVSGLKGEKISGHLMALDKKTMTTDDLVLCEIVAHEVAARLDNFFLLRQLQQTATADAQIRLARDLHDGLLQSLTGVALQLETAQRLIESEPQTARQRIHEIQQLLAAEQRELRLHINELRPFLPDRPAEDFGLADRLQKLAEQIRLQWDPAIEITLHPPAPRITRSMAREIYFVVNESLINAVRHAGASCVRAELSFDSDRVNITVSDDGKGFPFRGRYELDTLFEMKRGPMTLKERISALEGTLSIDSRETGSHLDITLPLTEHGA